MPVTSLNTIRKGTSMWAIAMIIPFVIMFNRTMPDTVNPLLMFLFYPILMSFLSRNGEFWVDQKVVAGSAVLASILAIVVSRLSTNAKKAIKNPDDNRRDAIIYYGSITVSFIVFMALLSYYVLPMYGL